MLYLKQDDLRSLQQFGGGAHESLPVPDAVFGKLFKLKVSIDQQNVKIGPPEWKSEGKSIMLPLELPSWSAREVLYEIELRTLIAKDRRQYPVHLADPTLNPKIVFGYKPNEVTTAAAEAFFNGKRPFASNIEPDTDRRRIIVTSPRDDEPEGWVFPNSGVLFTWQLDPPVVRRVDPGLSRAAAAGSEPRSGPAESRAAGATASAAGAGADGDESDHDDAPVADKAGDPTSTAPIG